MSWSTVARADHCPQAGVAAGREARQNGCVSTPEHPSDPTLRILELPSGPISYTDEGQGPAILALHGAPGFARDWRWLGPPLEARGRLIRLEFPGFGETPLSTMPDASIEARAALVDEVAATLELERYVVMGHSQGGAVAMRVARRHPDRLAGLALLASVGGRPHRALRGSIDPRPISAGLRFAPTRWLLMPIVRRAWRAMGFPRSSPDSAVIQSVHWTAALDFAAVADDIAALGTTSLPTLLAWTEDDPLVEPAIARELAEALPDGPRLSYPEGGHNLQKTCAVELGAALVEFARSV